MSDGQSPFPARLRDALVALTPDRLNAIEELRGLYADDIVFRDPIQEVRGIAAFIEMNRRLLGKMKSLAWDVKLATGDDRVALLEWTMSGATKLGAKIRVDGMTRVLARGGLVFDHRDYWDLGELIASPIPGGQRILHLLRSPLA